MSAITLTEAKAYLRGFDSSYTAEDTLIQSLIDSAEAWVEKYTDHVLSQRTEILEQGCHEVYSYPLIVDKDASTGSYSVDKRSLKSIISVSRGANVSVKIGYATPSAIPGAIKTAVLKMVVYLYENRDVYTSELPFDLQILINQYRRSIAFA